MSGQRPPRQPRVLLMTLSQRTSGKGNAYLAGWLGRASVVAFAGEPDKWGNPTWDMYAAEPAPREARDGRAEGRQGEFIRGAWAGRRPPSSPIEHGGPRPRRCARLSTSPRG